jgi:hypothetical protein
MTQSRRRITIDTIKTTTAITGSRVGVIYAPEEANPGSLESLTRFLNEHDIAAIPGYTGKDHQHVLRISNFKDDKYLYQLLMHEFPKWEKTQFIETKILEEHILFPASLQLEPLLDNTIPVGAPIENFMRNNSQFMAGLSYILGALLMTTSAIKPFSPTQKNDWYRFTTGIGYVLSSTVLLKTSNNSENKRSIREIIREIEPELIRDGILSDESTVRNKQTIELEGASNYISDIMDRYPWEISSILNAISASALIASSKNRGIVELTASAIGLLSLLITALVPQKGGRQLIDIPALFTRPDGTSILDGKFDNPVINNVSESISPIINWIRENPVSASAKMVLFTNLMHFGSSLFKHHGTGGLGKKDYYLTGYATTAIVGNLLQTFSSKATGPGYDDVMSVAAEYMKKHPELVDDSDHLMNQKIDIFGEKLTQQPEIVQDKKQIIRGIQERFARHEPELEINRPRDYLSGFLPTEKRILAQSPFVSPRIVERHLSSTGPQIHI